RGLAAECGKLKRQRYQSPREGYLFHLCSQSRQDHQQVEECREWQEGSAKPIDEGATRYCRAEVPPWPYRHLAIERPKVDNSPHHEGQRAPHHGQGGATCL